MRLKFLTFKPSKMHKAKIVKIENFHILNSTGEIVYPTFEESSRDYFMQTGIYSFIELHTPITDVKGKTFKSISEQSVEIMERLGDHDLHTILITK